jgi:hypothetical protein
VKPDQGRKVLIVGSVPLSSAEEVFRQVSTILGTRVRRIPDGETGDRLQWVFWQKRIFANNPMLTSGDAQEAAGVDWRNADVPPEQRLWSNYYRLQSEAQQKDLVFGPLGYAEVAKESYSAFARLKRDGVIHEDCKFQVSLPTPYCVFGACVAPDSRLAIEGPYERRMAQEIQEIVKAIPAGELAIQWDAAHEIENLDGARPHWFQNPEEGILERLVRLGEYVPDDVELGYHFCYGDFAHKHIVEPTDMGTMVRVANALARRIDRKIDWIHMPVPKDRSDGAYFVPLTELSLSDDTELYLGLVHFTDGVAGTRKRLQAASSFRSKFGISTECGFGRRAPETIVPLLKIHAEVLEAGNP